MRFCESIELNKWDHPASASETTTSDDYPFVYVNNFGISNTEETLVFAEDVANPGAGKLLLSAKEVTTEGPHGARYEMKVCTLDLFAAAKGWFVSRPNIAVV